MRDGPLGIPVCTNRSPARPCRGFTLVEMLAVMTVVVILLSLVIPAMVQVGGARNLTKGAYDISGALEQARAYAKAYSTYTWVGFYEEAADKAAGTTGTGRVIVSTVASKNAVAMYDSTNSNPPALTTLSTTRADLRLVQVGGLVKIDNVHLTVLNTTEILSRGKVLDSSGSNPVNVQDSYQVGDEPGNPMSSAPSFAYRSTGLNQTTFNYPLYSGSPTYTFVKVIQFNPLGDATKVVDSPYPLIEIGLRPARGSTVDTNSKNCAALQVAGIGGLVRLYRP